MIDKVRLLATAAMLALAGCVAYEPVPVPYTQLSPQERYERSWQAATGALIDQGLTVTTQDRASGTIRGNRGNITVTATVEMRADSRVQVRFDSAGASNTDPGLIDRVSDSYNRRMGR